jgi:predicted nuclease of predicted toxin-antitoxin system
MNISPQTVSDLCRLGWDTVRVNQVLPATATDDTILEHARAQNRVVLTQDLDFSALLALSGQDRPSLVTIRTSSADPAFVISRLENTLPAVETQLSAGSIVTIEDTSYRVRSLPIA